VSLCAWYFKYAVVPDHDMHSATVESYLLICWAVPGVLQWRDHALLFSRFRFGIPPKKKYSLERKTDHTSNGSNDQKQGRI